MRGLRLGLMTLVAGGALAGGLLFGGALVSAQTPTDTPSAEEETPTDATSPQIAPDASETPAETPGDADKSDTDDADATLAGSDKAERDGHCDKDGDGQPDARPDGGTRFNGAPSSGAQF